jgi:Xaa-Pro aminopeptidase
MLDCAVPFDRPSPDVYAARRRRIMERLGTGALVLGGGELKTRSNDTEFRFRPDSDFYYLTGLAEPGSVLVLRPGHERPFTLFVRPRVADRSQCKSQSAQHPILGRSVELGT